MCVLVFSTIVENISFEEELREIPSKTYIGLHAKYPL